MAKNFHVMFFGIFFISFVLIYVVFFNLSSQVAKKCYDCSLDSCGSRSYKMAVEKSDFRFCYEVNSTSFCKDFCFYNVVKKTGNLSVCEFINGSDLREICVRNN